MFKKEYIVKERYCPLCGENVVVKVEASAEHREICVSCGRNRGCEDCLLGINGLNTEKAEEN